MTKLTTVLVQLGLCCGVVGSLRVDNTIGDIAAVVLLLALVTA